MVVAPGYEKESTLTRKSQITIPKEIIRMLELKEGDKVKLSVQKNGTVLLSRVEEVKEDPVLEKFLSFLEKDMEENPFHLKPIPNDLLKRAVELVGHLDVDLDEELQDDEELKRKTTLSVDEDLLILNGWIILAHPLFIEQLEQLVVEVYELAQKKPNEYQKKSSTKRLAAIIKLILKVIPEDPSREEYKQGKTLGEKYKHWCRAKFLQRYRLFFRYHSKKNLIVYVWVNDETCKRTYESKTDAYYVFSKMLESGYPPDDWENLVEQSLTSQSQFHTLIKDNL